MVAVARFAVVTVIVVLVAMRMGTTVARQTIAMTRFATPLNNDTIVVHMRVAKNREDVYRERNPNMDIILLLARLVLALLFVVAGLAKLADLRGSQRALRDFGVPTRLAPPLGTLLPVVELAVALALIPTESAWWAAIGALLLLLLFVTGISYNLVQGRTPDCHCFGQLYSKPIGWSTLIRNLALVALASFVIGFGWSNPGLSFFAWLGSLPQALLIGLIIGGVLLVPIVMEGWLLLEMMRQQGRLLVRLETLEKGSAGDNSAPGAVADKAAFHVGLPIGSQAPGFGLSGLYGEILTLEALRAPGLPVALLFSDPGCGPCNTLMPEIGRWQREYAGKLTIAIISRGTPESNRVKSIAHGITQVLLQKDSEVAEVYKCFGTPGAVLIRPDGQIASVLSQGADSIRTLIATAVGLPTLRDVPSGNARNGNTLPMATPANSKSAVPAANPGKSGQVVAEKARTQAPDFSLPDLSGKTFSLAHFRGSKTLLLFWNPGCGFCQRMLADLRTWEANPPADAPKLLVISTGSIEENRALGLHSPVLLDQGMNVGHKFGATGTPMAVLIDAQGKVASEVAAGAPAVLALTGLETPTNGNGAANAAASVVLKVGDIAPAFNLPNLSGKRISLSDYQGTRTLLLFWNPDCGFCQRMLADLKAWEANPPAHTPKLLVVSTGDPESNQALGLRSPILLDQGMSVGYKFGANGTPMAVLVDARGKIASELAKGASEVLALAGVEKEQSGIISL